MKKSELKEIIKEEVIGIFSENKINEVEMHDYYTGGKKVKSTWAGETDSLKEFTRLIKNIPETLKFIKVPTNTDLMNPPRKKFETPITDSKKREIIKIVKQLDKDFKEKDDPITKYYLNSYGGNKGGYISYKTRKKDEFGRSMKYDDSF